MSLTAREIADAVAELRPRIEGASIESVGGVGEDDLALHVSRGDGVRTIVAISLRDGLTRIHRATRPAPAGAPSAGQATQRLAAWAREAAIRSIESAPRDRVVTLVFEHGRRLRFELFAKHARWIALAAGGAVDDLSAPLRSRARVLEVGSPDVPPAPPPFDPPPSRFPGPTDDLATSRAIEELYAPLAERALVDDARAHLAKRVAARRANRADRDRGLRARIAEAEQADILRRRAELLSGARHAIPRGARSARVVDWFDPAQAEIEIPLDPAVDLGLQIERLFARARRLASGLAASHEELARVAREVAALDEAARRAVDAPGLESIDKLARDLEAARLLPAEGRSKPRPGRDPASEPRRFRSADGVEILVGKNDRQNDLLTFRLARGNDLWLHVGSGAGGSHVVVRLARDRSAPLETLLDAAALAVHFSQLRGAARAEVVYAPRKRVTKPRGAPPGRVAVAGEKRIEVDRDRARLERLLRGDEPALP
ncbi:MAG TPA: NFACT RNA binding domain-containing protein [Planctomycetota bacterium]|nr:NFACT RNA binding domain-containing protein [Planctomycetota bacterium]